ncbi:unnamed protein product [Linum trigynum]|uniref:Uncharacterized protein n=1 Tax=Linum trigynum TaxID=586398 RepID=A0AAV2DKC1_9ROSI
MVSLLSSSSLLLPMPHCPLLLPLNRSATILNLPLTPIPPPLDKSNFNSVLVSLLDSHYTELGDLVEKALPTL